FFRGRVRIELAWLSALAADAAIAEVPPFSDATKAALAEVAERFSVDDAARIKAIERKTNHDVKAVEYWLKECLAGVAEVARVAEFIHFACTSEDINNLAHGLALAEARRDVLLPLLHDIIADLRALEHTHADAPMLGRTHGKAATPTTLGKEIANVVARLDRQAAAFSKVVVKGKM